jgi:hypothetical protein
MQLARYVPADAAGRAEITVVVLPGEAGGRLANINRWRRQLGVEPITEAQLSGALSPLEVTGAQTYLVDFPNPDTRRRMAAAGVTRGERTWFFKLTGEEALVARERGAFLEFIRTTRYEP